MPSLDTLPPNKPSRENSERKEIIRTVVGEYQSDPLVLADLREIFPDYEDGILHTRAPDPRLEIDEIKTHLTAIDDGVNAYSADQDTTRHNILRRLTVGRQALLFDHWGYVSSIVRRRVFDTAKMSATDFGQNAIIALTDAIANFKDRDHPDKFRNYIGITATNSMVSGIRKLYRTPEVAEAFEPDASDEEIQRSIRSEASAHQLREILKNADASPADITLLCLRFGIDPRLLKLPDSLDDTERDKILLHMPDGGYSSDHVAPLVGRRSGGAVRVAQNGIIKAIRIANNIIPKT